MYFCIHDYCYMKMNNFKYTSSNFIILEAKIMLAPKVIKCIVNMNFINFNSFYFYCQYLDPLQIWKGIVHIWYKKGDLKGKNTMVHNRVLECFKHAQVLLKHNQFPWNFDHWKFASNEVDFKKIWQTKLLCSLGDFSWILGYII